MRSSKKSSTKQKTSRGADRIVKTRKRAASNEPLDVYVQAAAHVLELPLPPVWRDSVAANLQTSLRLAASFADFPLPDGAEPAPVFGA
jgi:Protein of unknown function (DUF4089)